MFEINLAPWRAYQRLRSAKFFALSLVVVCLLSWTTCAVIALYLREYLAHQNSQRMLLEGEILDHRNALRELSIQLVSNAEVLKGASELRHLLSARDNGYAVLFMLANTMPARARYLSIDLDSNGLTVLGMAESNQVVARLIKSISASDLKFAMQLLDSKESRLDSTQIFKTGTPPGLPQFPSGSKSVKFQLHGTQPSGNNNLLGKPA